MKNNKRLSALLCAFMLAGSLLVGCGTGAQGGTVSSTTGQTGGDAAMPTSSASDKVKAEDLDASWSEADATNITLSGDTATVDGNGASANGRTVTISTAGTFVVSGTLNDGQIVVNAPTEALVRLVLNGAVLSNNTTAPIVCQQADKLLVILAEGTENTLTDDDSYVFPDAATDEPSAALFSKADLTINGTGALAVNAAYNNGIGTKDDLIIVSGSITVNAPNHAIRGRDSVTVLDGTLNLTAGADGIQTNNDTDVDKGWIELYGGSYTIASGNDGVQAEQALTVYGGTFTLTTGGGSANAPERAAETMGGGRPQMGGAIPAGEIPAGGPGGTPPQALEGQPAPGTAANAAASATTGATEPPADTASDATSDAATADATTDAPAADENTESTSYKGLKAAGALTIAGGTFSIDSADDALHANTDVTVSSGNLAIATGDDGIHADNTLTVENDSVINITASYEGLEGAAVFIKGGRIDIVASDDGINAAGGRDDTAASGLAPDSFASGDYLVCIEGGDTAITAGADGVDANGDIAIAGGTLLVNMTNYQTMGGDGALDRDGSLTLTGGTVMAAAGNGIVTMGPSNTEGTSAQAMLEVYYSTVQQAGTTVELKDSTGGTLASFTPTNSFQCVVFTAPGMAVGQAYTLHTGGTETVATTLSATVTSIQDTGEAAASQMGGGGAGGRGQRPAAPDVPAT